jgi:hypothetical protein
MLGRQNGEQRQLHPLHRSLDASQGMTPQGNFVRGEDQAKVLLLTFALEFGEGELIEWQQQALFS